MMENFHNLRSRVQEATQEWADYFSILTDNATDKLGNALAFITEKGAWILVRLIIISILCWLMLTTSLGGYLCFRWLYLPEAQHVRPVYMDFGLPKTSIFQDQPLVPISQVNLVEPGYTRLLRAGQTYDISMTFEVPDSEVNQLYGMFMVSMQLQATNNAFTIESKRPAILRYRSPLLRKLWLAVYSPAYLMGILEEKQTIRVFMFEDFVDNKNHPISNVIVRISKPLQIYSAAVHFDAHFTGMRSFLYWYPEMAGLTIVAIFFSIQSIFVLGLYVIYYVQISLQEDDGEADRLQSGYSYDNNSNDRHTYLATSQPENVNANVYSTQQKQDTESEYDPDNELLEQIERELVKPKPVDDSDSDLSSEVEEVSTNEIEMMTEENRVVTGLRKRPTSINENQQ